MIYCEAFKSQHVEKVIQGLSGVNTKSVRMIPINEMTEVMKSCQTQQKLRFQEHQWVRIKGGIYKDDLGLVEKTEGNKKALVRLIPRIPNDFYLDQNKTIHSLRAYHKKSQFIRVPQVLFNPLRVKNECQRDWIKPMRKNFYIWRGMMFRNGYLYQEFTANKLLTENVCPSLQEVKMFQIDVSNQTSLDFEDDDQDEWDILDDETLLKTIRDDPQLQIQIGERIKVIEGQFKDCQGFIRHFHDGIVTFTTEEKKPVTIKVKGFQVRKCFKLGETVQIIQGNRAQESGIVTQLLQDGLGLDTHAVLSMNTDGSHSNLTVPINNIRIKTESDAVHQAQHSLKQAEQYVPGDLIQYDGHKKLGYVIQTGPDSVTVLNEFNSFDLVKVAEIQRKVVQNRLSSTTDADNNVIARGTLIKIKDKGDPMKGQLGEIKALFRDTLFVWIKSSLLIKSHGYYCIHAKMTLNAGAKHLQQMNEATGLNPNEAQANPDRNKRDTLLRNVAVVITSGPLKGLRGTVVSATETFAEVHVHSKCQKVAIARSDLQVLFNAMEGIRLSRAGDNVPVQISFDDAANQEYVNVQDQDGGFATQWGPRLAENVNADFGDQTPVGSALGADDVMAVAEQ